MKKASNCFFVFLMFCTTAHSQQNSNRNQPRKTNTNTEEQPIKFISFGFVEYEGDKVLCLSVHNNTDKEISSFRCMLKYFDQYDRPVNYLNTGSNMTEITNQTPVYANLEGVVYVQINYQEETRKLKATLKEVFYADGTFWSSRNRQYVKVPFNDGQDKNNPD